MKMRKLAPNVPVFASSENFRASTQRSEGAQEPKHRDPEANSLAVTASGKPRLICMVSIDLIDSNPLASREVYTPRMIRDRAIALLTQGQRDPIHVIPHPNKPGRFIIADGWIRVQACRDYHVMHDLLAEVHEGMSIEKAAWFGYEQNEAVHHYYELDRAMFYEKLTQRGSSATEIAKCAHLSSSQMTYYSSFAQLPADVMEIVQRDPRRFDAIAAHQISKVVSHVGEKQAAKLASKYCEKERRISWLFGQVQALIETKKYNPLNLVKKIKLENGVIKQRGSKISVKITIDDPAKRAWFAARMEKLLATCAGHVAIEQCVESVGDDDQPQIFRTT